MALVFALLLAGGCRSAEEAARAAAVEERVARLEVETDGVAVERRREDDRHDQEIEELEGRVARLERQLDRLGNRPLDSPFDPLPAVLPPRIEAVVTGVDQELNIVMLSAGRRHGVRAGYEFTVYRGTEYVTKVVIARVEDEWCSGESKRVIEKSPVRVGDKATTRF